MPHRLDKTQKLALISNTDQVINLFKEYPLTLENDNTVPRRSHDEQQNL